MNDEQVILSSPSASIPDNGIRGRIWFFESGIAQGRYMPKIKWGNFIQSDPSVLLGKPVVKGTRLAVEFIPGLYAEGWTEDQILENYPDLTKESLLADFAYTRTIDKERNKP